MRRHHVPPCPGCTRDAANRIAEASVWVRAARAQLAEVAR